MGIHITGDAAKAIAATMGIDLKEKRRHKYNAKPTEVIGSDGKSMKFDSKKEAQRYGVLSLLEKAGEIKDLKTHSDPECKFSLNAPSGERIGFYEADFVYLEKGRECRTVEDAKGIRTPMYKWKARHMLLQYGIRILET